MNIIMTSPSVPYLIEYADGTSVHVSNIAQWPEVGRGAQFTVKEPMVKVRGGGAVGERGGCVRDLASRAPIAPVQSIWCLADCALTRFSLALAPPLLSLPLTQVILITPKDYYGEMCEIVKDRRGTEIETQFLDDGQVLLSGAVSARSCVRVFTPLPPLAPGLSPSFLQVLLRTSMPWQEVRPTSARARRSLSPPMPTRHRHSCRLRSRECRAVTLFSLRPLCVLMCVGAAGGVRHERRGQARIERVRPALGPCPGPCRGPRRAPFCPSPFPTQPPSGPTNSTLSNPAFSPTTHLCVS